MSFPPGLVLAPLNALPDPGAVVVAPDPAQPLATIILTRRGGRVAAFRNKCPHAGYPLQRADGRVTVQEGRFMVCGGHGASFNLDDGACAGGPCNGDPLERIEIEVRGGSVVAK